MRVLIASNHPATRDLLRKAASDAGHQVETADNGAAALQAVRAGRARMVIADWEMPEIGALELCRAIRSSSNGAQVFIVLLTARDGSQDTLAALAAGADEFLSEPFNAGEVAARLRSGERALSVEARDLVLFAMASLAESRDAFTGDHINRVRKYSTALADDLRQHPKFAGLIDAAFVKQIYLTSTLHDIGKLALPDNVLLKPGRLSEREFQIMKMHTSVGGQTIQAVLRQFPDLTFLQMAYQIATSHHERYDGSGYPSGLKGNDIPLAARIMALADVYDALRTRRSYKPAFDHKLAKEIILQSKSTHFDPDVVDAFVRREQMFIEIERQSTAQSPDSMSASDAA